MPVKKVKSQKSKVKSESKATKIVTQKVEKAVTKSVVKTGRFTVPVYTLTGRTAGTINLPKEIFGQPVNEKLLAQAIRAYMTNQKNLLASTKTRGEVEGSSVKISRQKGTGRARHGSIRAPIFVGGGIVFGPKPRKVKLELPKAMKKSALISALSSKVSDQNILALTGLEKATGKTNEMYQLLKKISGSKEKIKSALIVTEGKADNVVRAIRNIPEILCLPVDGINAYEVLKHQMLLFTKESIGKLSNLKSKEAK